jgi:energy-coupling factor transport system ATP-binding protein
VFTNEILCILGGNGAGKSTTLSVIAGLEKFYSGSIKIFDKKISDYKNQDLYRNCIALLPQDVQTMFVSDTVKDELTTEPIIPYDYNHYANRHPYDLSGGEMQLLALCKVLETSPKILLLDEPTKGLDANYKNKLIGILKQLKSQGLTIIIVSHDIEFASQCADRCALFFNGSITSINATTTFFNDNNFYTTVSNKMTRGYYENIITLND